MRLRADWRSSKDPRGLGFCFLSPEPGVHWPRERSLPWIHPQGYTLLGVALESAVPLAGVPWLGEPAVLSVLTRVYVDLTNRGSIFHHLPTLRTPLK